MSPLRSICILLTSLLLSGCYYGHLAKGEYDLLSKSEPIADILKNGKHDAALKQRLKTLLDVRSYASQVLKLPDNDSYTQYVDLQRPFVLWNVFAAPELSMEPLEHCFLFAGCVAYRGYFDERSAQDEAAELKADGYEVHVAGVSAYSTLGWFDDPVISTMMRGSDEFLISTVFHELAHQQLYLKGDTAFNESFASFVGEEGARQYLSSRGQDTRTERLRRQREDQFISLILETRASLKRLYEGRLSDDKKRERKQKALGRLKARYAELRAGEWKDFDDYDRWFSEEINNARLLPFGMYHEWVTAFARLFREQKQDWTKFYAAAERLSGRSEAERHAELRRLRNATD